MSYAIRNVVEVQIHQDPVLVGKFLDWQLSRGGPQLWDGAWYGVNGRDLRAFFSTQDAEAIEKFFAEHG